MSSRPSRKSSFQGGSKRSEKEGEKPPTLPQEGFERFALAREADDHASSAHLAMFSPIGDVYASSGYGSEEEEVVMGPLIGSGSFGKVYKGKWRSRTVAIKVIHGQTSASADRWLQIEVQLAMVLKHPNIVRCYYVSTPPVQGHARMSFTKVRCYYVSTPPLQSHARMRFDKHFHIVDSARASTTRLSYSVRSSQSSHPITPVASFTSQHPPILTSSPHAAGLLAVDSAATLHAPSLGHDTQLVMEFCDQGSLADASISKRFFTMNGMAPNMRAVLMRAKDIAAGMRYLHTCNVCHGDLKCENVLLQSDPTDPYACVAKVGDFGLSGIMNDGRTHVSARQNCGTISHTAPEVLAAGQLCPASDVYSYGIIHVGPATASAVPTAQHPLKALHQVWEMVTAQPPFAGLRDMEISRRVRAGERPSFPAHIPEPFVMLAEDCWAAQPEERPSFDGVLLRLRKLLQISEELQQRCEEPLKELHSWLMTF